MRLTPLLSDNAVLQRYQSIPVWGWTDQPKTRLRASLAGVTREGISGDDGRFLLRLPAMAGGGPHTLTVETIDGDESAGAENILIGEVWLASGQSNMQWSMADCHCADEIRAANPAQIRMFTVERRADHAPQSTVRGHWDLSTPETAGEFSAAATFFGNRLQNELNVPVGIIHASWGGTVIETWISRERLLGNPDRSQWVREYEDHCFTHERWRAAQGEERFPADPGNLGIERGWHLPGPVDEDWDVMPLPSTWQERGHPYSGVFWFRRRVRLPDALVGRDLTLRLGAIDKHDVTYVNGTEVGRTGEGFDQTCFADIREYPVPASLVRDDELVVAVRVYSFAYAGGMTGPSDLMAVLPRDGDEEEGVAIDGNWRCYVEHNFGAVDLTQEMGHEVPNSPYMLFENMIRPQLPVGIAGAIWYQGESNAIRASQYARLMKELIRDWRFRFGLGEFPFIQVQLASFREASEHQPESTWAHLREAQCNALELPNTGLAVIIDAGEAGNIHPFDKATVGRRLARWALTRVYGRPGVPGSPIYRDHRVEGNSIRIFFEHAESGLALREGDRVETLFVAGADGSFRRARSTIDGSSLVAWHDAIAEPVAVRYAWADNPDKANLVNAEGFPASPFRTDADPTV